MAGESASRALRDIRDACRAIGKAKLVAAVTVVSLAVGIGVNTVVFSWVQAVVLDPIPGVPAPVSVVLGRAADGQRHVSRHVLA